MTGAFAPYDILPVSAVRRKPDGFTFAQAAAFGAAYYTGYHALVRRAALVPGEWVLVHGATGGVGLAGVDLARQLGARVIATSASQAKLDLLSADYKPDAVIDSTSRFREQVMDITGGKGADIILDPVGGDVFQESLRCIAFNGRYLVVGFTSGTIPQVGVNIALIKGFSILGVRAGEYGRRFPERGQEDREAIWQLAERGRLSPRVHAQYPLSRWRDAFERLAARDVVGRVVLIPEYGA